MSTESTTPAPIVAQKIVDAEEKGKDTGVSTEVEAREVAGEGEGKVDETAGRRVHIGNLPYTAKEEEVKAFISSAGGTVSSLELITRSNGRPAGFGFAVYPTKEEAEAVVGKLNKASFQDRELYVVIARPLSEKREPRERKPRARKTTAGTTATTGGETTDADAGEKVEGTEGEGEGESRKKKKSQRKKRPARRLPEASEDAPASTLEEPVTTTAEPPLNDIDSEEKKPKKKRAKKPRAAKTDDNNKEVSAGEARIDVAGEETAVEAEGKEKKSGSGKKARSPRSAPTGEPSSTLLFVANLPFNVDDKALSEMFTNLNISIKSAKVITKRAFIRNRKGSSTEKQTGTSDAEGGQTETKAQNDNETSKAGTAVRRSKGFGFVETINEEEQKKAVKALEGYKIGEREITVKIANERQPIEEQGKELAEKVEKTEGEAVAA